MTALPTHPDSSWKSSFVSWRNAKRHVVWIRDGRAIDPAWSGPIVRDAASSAVATVKRLLPSAVKMAKSQKIQVDLQPKRPPHTSPPWIAHRSSQCACSQHCLHQPRRPLHRVRAAWLRQPAHWPHPKHHHSTADACTLHAPPLPLQSPTRQRLVHLLNHHNNRSSTRKTAFRENVNRPRSSARLSRNPSTPPSPAVLCRSASGKTSRSWRRMRDCRSIWTADQCAPQPAPC